MVKLKYRVRSSLSAYDYVQCFKGIVLFESEISGYKIVSRCQSPEGHTL